MRLLEDKFAKAFAFNPAGVCITRQSDGSYLDANPAYLRMVGDQQFQNRGHFFAACAEAIDELKVSVPLWKKEVYVGGEEWIGQGS
mgnify:CR=1 FL=1